MPYAAHSNGPYLTVSEELLDGVDRLDGERGRRERGGGLGRLRSTGATPALALLLPFRLNLLV